MLDYDRGMGHNLDYNLSVGEAARLAGWQHVAALTRLWQVPDLPPGWDIRLQSPDFTRIRGQPLRQLAGIVQLARSLARYIRREVVPRPGLSILFLETFSLATLLAFALAVWLAPMGNIAVCLLYRGVRDFTRGGWHGRAYRLLNRTVRLRLPPGRLQLLTDSSLLAESLSAYFAEPVGVMPIPHTPVDLEPQPVRSTGAVVCWWPGPPRSEKGLDVMRRLVASTADGASELLFRAAESSGLAACARPDGPRVQAVKDQLSRREYLGLLATSHLILLPYHPEAYRERTSGIFVESVVAGRPPLVSANTWMASELENYGLGALVIDWTGPALPDRLRRIASDTAVQADLARMQSEYRRYHSVRGYADALQLLLGRITAD